MSFKMLVKNVNMCYMPIAGSDWSGLAGDAFLALTPLGIACPAVTCVFSSPMRQRSSAVWAYSWAARAAFAVQRSATVARTARASLSICSNFVSVISITK